MASKETQVLDDIIASRRALLVSGGAALAALAMPTAVHAATTVATYSDLDILNFALNLEYLEANFYYLAAFGTPIYTANTLYTGAAMVQGITGSGTQGTVVVKPTSTRVPFVNANIAAYCVETAIEEGNHVNFLRTAINNATANYAAAMPQIDLLNSFNGLAAVAGIGPTFDPFASDANFLLGAYIFEDVGVTAYHGAAPLISTSATGKTYLAAATGILAVEAYHAGLVRTSLNAMDAANGNTNLSKITQQISNVRASLSKAVGPASSTYETYPDDIPLLPTTGVTTYTVGKSLVTATNLVNADQTNVIAFTRNTTQVLNIVTAGGAATAGSKSIGGFFPVGLNGLFT